jgi:hypothetical protein
MSVGYTGLIISLALAGGGVLLHNRRLLLLGGAYVLASLLILGIRGAMHELDRIRKRRYSKYGSHPKSEPVARGTGSVDAVRDS